MNLRLFLKNHIYNVIFFLLATFILIGFLYLGRFALPMTDDFADAVFVMNDKQQTQNSLLSAWNLTKATYLNSQGTFFSVFALEYLLLILGTNFYGYRLCVQLLILFFFASYALFSYVIAKHFHMSKVWGVLLFATLWVGVDLVGPGEFTMYVVGACVYSLPLALGFLGLSCYIRLLKADGVRKVVLLMLATVLLIFMACGGVLMVSAMVNMWIVLLMMYHWYSCKKIPWRGILPFLVAFATSLANALAPGNFLRYGSGVATQPDYLGSVLNTFKVVNELLIRLTKFTYLPVALVLIAVVVLFTRTKGAKEDYRLNPLIMLIADYFMSFIVMFPCVLGYRLTPGAYVAERVVFTFSVITALSIGIFWTYFMLWLKMRMQREIVIRTKHIICALMLGIVLFAGNTATIYYARGAGNHPTITEFVKEYSRGYLENYYLAYRLALQAAKDAPEGSAYAISHIIPESSLYMNPTISSDSEWWVNRSIAMFYQLSVVSYAPDHGYSSEDITDAGYSVEELMP